MYLGIVLFLFSIIQADHALPQPAKKWNVLQAFVPNGLYGGNLTIRRGKEILCDIPAASLPHNTTCKDNQSLVFLHSNNSLTLITEAMNKMYYLEHNGEETLLQFNRTFDSLEEAFNYLNPITKAAELSKLYWLLILIPIILIVIAVVFWIKCRKKRGERNRPDPSNQQLESFITPQPISNTQNQRNGTYSNGVSAGKDLTVFLDSDSKKSNV